MRDNDYGAPSDLQSEVGLKTQIEYEFHVICKREPGDARIPEEGSKAKTVGVTQAEGRGTPFNKVLPRCFLAWRIPLLLSALLEEGNVESHTITNFPLYLSSF